MPNGNLTRKSPFEEIEDEQHQSQGSQGETEEQQSLFM